MVAASVQRVGLEDDESSIRKGVGSRGVRRQAIRSPTKRIATHADAQTTRINLRTPGALRNDDNDGKVGGVVPNVLVVLIKFLRPFSDPCSQNITRIHYFIYEVLRNINWHQSSTNIQRYKESVV